MSAPPTPPLGGRTPPRCDNRTGGHDDWRVGDLALCVTAGQWNAQVPDASGIALTSSGDVADGPNAGSIHGVNHVIYAIDIIWLGFSAWPEDLFDARNFRKVTPDAADSDDAEVIAALRGDSVPGVLVPEEARAVVRQAHHERVFVDGIGPARLAVTA